MSIADAAFRKAPQEHAMQIAPVQAARTAFTLCLILVRKRARCSDFLTKLRASCMQVGTRGLAENDYLLWLCLSLNASETAVRLSNGTALSTHLHAKDAPNSLLPVLLKIY